MNWAESAEQLLAKDKLEDNDYVSWAAFHAATQSNPEDPIAPFYLYFLRSLQLLQWLTMG